jgi:hypothetical protein
MSSPLLISYCNSPEDDTHKNTLNFIRSLENNGWKYSIINRGEKWEGFITRMKGYLTYLLSLDPNQIVILSDARDVFCCRCPTQFINNFKKYDKKIVVSMELFAEGNTYYEPTKTYYQVTWIEKYWKYYNIDYTKINRKFVNNGLITGYVSELIKLLKWSLNNNYTDDQKALGAYVNEFPELVYADINAELLHTTGAFVTCGLYDKPTQNFDSPSFSELSGLGPYFLHIPGATHKENLPGQNHLYNCVNSVIDICNQQHLNKLYPQYKEVF